MTASWMLRHKVKRFFHNNFEIRTRIEKQLFGDKIHRAVFTKTLEKAFTGAELRTLLDETIIVKEQIFDGKSVRNVYVWLEEACEWQPIWHKRMIQKFVRWLSAK